MMTKSGTQRLLLFHAGILRKKLPLSALGMQSRNAARVNAEDGTAESPPEIKASARREPARTTSYLSRQTMRALLKS